MTQTAIQQTYDQAVRHHQAGQLAQAEALYRQILSASPNHSDALHLLGVLAHQLGQDQTAHQLIARAIALNPGVSTYHQNFGIVLAALGRTDDAIAAYERALAIQPDYAKAQMNLAEALYQKNRLKEAISAAQRAVTLDPNSSDAFNILGTALHSCGMLDGAKEAYAKAVELAPNAMAPLNNLANVEKDTGHIDTALALYRRAVMAVNSTPEPHSHLIYSLQLDPNLPPEGLLEEARRFDERHAKPLAGQIVPLAHDRSPDRRPRIGYVSPDFRENVVGWNLLPILENHDKKNFEIFCYSAVKNPDAMTEKLKIHTDGWRDISTLNDARAAEIVRQDKIDVLIDLSVHGGGNRLLIFARKPAPIQITYLGYNGTTGLSAMDHHLSDPHLDNADTEKYYSEKTLYLPDCYWCYRPGGTAPDVADAPSAVNGFITFGTLANFPKISLPAQKLWADILNQVKDSRLLLHAQPGKYLAEFRNRFSGWGISSDRLEFVAKQPWADYMRTYGRIDIALDPFPHGGAITTCDALWMGVPVITISGQLPMGRVGKSILKNVGLPEFVADTPEQYVDTAVQLAGDRGRLQKLRKTLRERMVGSPLMNAPQFTRYLEAAYRRAFDAL